MIVIGIDPGTNCGWAVLKDGKHVASGTWDLKAGRHEGGGMRYLRAQQYFKQLVASLTTPLDKDDIALAYEEVRRHKGVDAAHIYGGIVGVLTATCEELNIPFQAMPVGSVKRLATGKGNASKTEMIEAANKTFQLQIQSHQDDQADAIWMAKALYEELKA